MSLCKANNGKGKPCQSPAGANSEYCFFHNPDLTDERREAQRKGGSQGVRRQAMPTPPPCDFNLTDPAQISKLVSDTANRILRGELDPKFAYAITQLADCALRAHAAIEVSRRVDELEELAQCDQNTPYEPPADLFFELPDEADPSTSKGSSHKTALKKESQPCP